MGSSARILQRLVTGKENDSSAFISEAKISSNRKIVPPKPKCPQSIVRRQTNPSSRAENNLSRDSIKPDVVCKPRVTLPKLRTSSRSANSKTFSQSVLVWPEQFANLTKSYTGELVITGDLTITRFCVIHSEKPAEFFFELGSKKLNSSKQNFPNHARVFPGLCAPCSVKFSYQGVKLQEILIEPPNRKQQLDSFLFELDEALRTNLLVKNTLEAKILSQKRVLSETEKATNDFFICARKTLEESQQTITEELSRKEEILTNNFANLSQEAEINIKGVSFIKSDVMGNYSEIIEKIGDVPFNEILQNMKKQNNKFLAFSKSLSTPEDLERVLPFDSDSLSLADVANQIVSLAEQFKNVQVSMAPQEPVQTCKSINTHRTIKIDLTPRSSNLQKPSNFANSKIESLFQSQPSSSSNQESETQQRDSNSVPNELRESNDESQFKVRTYSIGGQETNH